MRRVLAFVPDLMDRSKVSAALPGDDVVYVADAGGLVPPADLAVLDLSRPGVLEALPGLVGAGVRTVGFLSHVDRDRAEAARAAGCGEVLARSAFFGSLPGVLAERRGS